jgi:hypothetical protein
MLVVVEVRVMALRLFLQIKMVLVVLGVVVLGGKLTLPPERPVQQELQIREAAVVAVAIWQEHHTRDMQAAQVAPALSSFVI